MIKIYGYSDDNLVIDGAPYPADEIDCYDHVVEVEFSDGTNIRAGYCKPHQLRNRCRMLLDRLGITGTITRPGGNEGRKENNEKNHQRKEVRHRNSSAYG